MKRILVIEDDPAILRGLETSLTEQHYAVVTATSGQKGLQIARGENIDLIILDLILPDMDGEDVCRELRSEGIGTPILMLTSKKDELDKVLGLVIGADDYVTKPFSIRELHARIRALLRRTGGLAKELEEYTFGDVHVDFRKQEVTRKHQPIRLSVKEFNILKHFIEHEGEVVTRDQLLDHVWGFDVFPSTRTVDNYILSLRKKLEENPSRPVHFLTVHTAGYKFVR
jgi:DNA-binding response OmpR family regulator